MDESTEAIHNVVEVTVDICMIKFYAGQDRNPRIIVQEFRTLIKKSGVVFIPLNDKEWAIS